MLVKGTACVVLLLCLSAVWLSTARLHPAGAEVNDISSINARVATNTINRVKVKNLAAIDGNLKKVSEKQVVRQYGNGKSVSRVESKRSFGTRLSDEFDGVFVAFTADYHSVRHHPPKNK